jgi:aspartate aminotransferase
MYLCKRAMNISKSLTLAIDEKSKKMKSEGYDVVGFGAGEPDFDTPELIKQAAKEALEKGITRYTPASGTLELKKAVCDKLRRDNGLDYEPNQIIISNGAKHSLYNTFQAILNPGDEVIIPTPYWLSYPEMVKMADGAPVFLETSEADDFKITMDALRNAVTPKTKAFILNSPSNPNGCVYESEELEEIAKMALDRKFLIISDEIYEELVYDGMKHISIASLGEDIKQQTITINGMSKAYAMTGWRIGYAAGPAEIIKVMGNIQSHSTSNPNSIAQYASVAALEASDICTREMVQVYSERRLFMVDRINRIEKLSCRLPKGAFYVMMNISQLIGKRYGNKVITGSISFAEALLESKMVSVVPGIAFGADSFVRLSYATSLENIAKGLDRIESFTKELE